MRNVLCIATLLILHTADMAYAEACQINDVRIRGIEKKSGELQQYEGRIKYIDWNFHKSIGKVIIILHYSARPETEDSIKIFIDTLRNNSNRLDNSKYETINILNTDDIFLGSIGKFFGESAAIESYEEDFKKRNNSIFVVDDSSVIRKSWGLNKNGNAAILLNKSGKVILCKDAKDGEVLLNEDESKNFLHKTMDIINQ